MMQISALDVSVVDEEVLIASGFLGGLGFANKSANVQVIGLFLYGNQFRLIRIAQQLYDPLFLGTGLQLIELLVVGGEIESYFGKGERDAG